MTADQAFPRGKRKSSSTAPTNFSNAATGKDAAQTKKRASEDVLFGSVEPTPTKKSKASTATKDKGHYDGAALKSAISALPLGGGAVLPPSSSASGRSVPAKIELLTFSKLGKGMKVLGVIREVREEYGVVALPTMLMGFVRREENGPPLTQVLPPPNTIMAFYILQTTTEDAPKPKGSNTQGTPQKKRRIELSPYPVHVNAGMRLDDFLVAKDNTHKDSSSFVVRGRIASVEDHGCLVDIGGIGKVHASGGTNQAFLKFEKIEGDYEIVENETMELDDDEEVRKQPKDSNIGDKDYSKRLINPGRIYDFLVSSPQHGPIVQLSLPSTHTLARTRLSTSVTPSLASLQPGMLMEVRVEQHAKNGMCVNFMGGLYRGSIDEDHLGGWRSGSDGKKNDVERSGTDVMWWKNVFRGKHAKFTARIIAVDTATKIIRFSLNPHILALRGEYASFPHPVGTIIENATVIRVDPGIGALLALPSSETGNDSKKQQLMDDILQLDKDLSNNLFDIPEYKAGSNVHTAYVHISKSIDCKEPTSNKKDKKGQKSTTNRTPEALFARHFSLNTKIKSLRILSTSHLIDGIASCATAKSIVDAHVLTHDDIVPGAIYRNVPVIQLLDGGGVLVDLGVGTKGIIPAMHLFDKASHGSLDTGGDMVLSGYRQKIRLAKYKVGSLVDVRCLTCDPVTKQCILTAKKTLLSTDIDNPIVDYEPPVMEVGRVAAGFISRVDENGVTVTFYNNVHGRASSRSLAAELGVEDPRLNYSMGDVIAARIVDCQRRRNRSTSGEEDNLYYYHLTLSLKTASEEEKAEPVAMEEDGAKKSSGVVPLAAGSILEAKRIKVLQLVNCLKRDDGMFLLGYAVVAVKSKFFTGLSHSRDSIEFKLPYDHVLDSYGDELSKPPVELDAIASRYLTVGKRIDAEGLILSVPKGVDALPIISLRPLLIDTMKKSLASEGEAAVTCPSPLSNLFMGEFVRGYVCRIDERFGAFVRFLDGLTGLIPKLKKGLNETLYDTILCKVTALDITSSPPKILLKKVTESEIAQNKKKSVSKGKMSNDSVHVDDVVSVKIVDINFARANVHIIGKSSEAKSRSRIHVTMAESVSTSHKLSKKEKQAKAEMKIGKSHPFYKWKVGDVIHNVRCVAVDFRDGVNYVELSNRMSGSIPPTVIVNDPSHLSPGSIISAIITSISCSAAHHGLWVQLCPGITGFVPALESSVDPDVLNDMQSHFNVGSRISVVVMDKSSTLKIPKAQRLGSDAHDDRASDHDVIVLSMLLASSNEGTKSHAPASRAPKPQRGDVVVGCINKKARMHGPPSLMLNLRGGFVGRCCITELSDIEEWVNMPLGKSVVASVPKSSNGTKQEQQRIVSDSDDHENEEENDDVNVRGDESEYPDEKYVKCCILGNVKSRAQMLEVSMRDSRLRGNLEDDSIPSEGDSVHGFVVSTTKVGCFVRLSRVVEGRVILKELSDEFIPRPDEMFPAGRLVAGKVKCVKELKPNKKNNLSAMVDVDMRESVLLTSGKRLTLDDIEENSKYTGVVTRVESYGVFVRIDNSDISGLAHVSECSDTYVKNLFNLYNPGDMVKLLVIKCDDEKKRLGFSLKASNFVDDDDSDVGESGDEDESNKETTYVLSSDNESSNEEDQDDQSVDSDDINFVSKMASKMSGADNDTEEESDSDNESDSDSSFREDKDIEGDNLKSLSQAMDTDVGFEWDASEKPSKKSKAEESSDDDSDNSSRDSSEDESEDVDVGFKSSHKSRKKAAKRKIEEEEISRRERALADGTADDNPETAADFERLVASSPNSSETWIKYMAFHLSLADIESARSVANRAFDRIEFRQEGEKLNVWTALLTLELKFGTDTSLQETVDRACQHNNPKQVYLRVCELLEKEVDASAGAVASTNLSNATKRADDMFSKMCKKFKSKKTVWMAFFKYLLKCSRHEEAHDLLKRSLQSLPKYKHVETMSKFAQMEFELGSPERGRTIFSALLENHSKRLDLLFVYVDKEIKNGDIAKARSLFDMVVNPVSDDRRQKFKFSDKQMKSLFKKWYRMEEEYGDEERQEWVKDEARAYVTKSKS